MRAGYLDRLIDIQRKTSTASDSGESIDAWNNIASRRAAGYRSLRGDERFAAPQVVAEEQVEFKIRYSDNVADLSPLDRIIYPASSEASPEDDPDSRRIYNILAVPEVGRREGLRIIAVRRADAPA